MAKNTNLHDRIHELTTEMVDKGIYWSEALAQLEKQFIQNALERNGGNLVRTAAAMGIHRNTLSRKLIEHKILKKKAPAKSKTL
jgi:DNA-binding NtrC family response regulator